MQKSEAVLGLEKVLSESIVQTPLSKDAYSRTIFSRFSFQEKDGVQSLATTLPASTVKPDEL